MSCSGYKIEIEVQFLGLVPCSRAAEDAGSGPDRPKPTPLQPHIPLAARRALEAWLYVAV